MLVERERKIYNKIVNAVSNISTCGSIGKTFCRVPSSVVTELKANGYCVTLYDPLGSPNLKNNRYLHNILVCIKAQ